MAIAKHEMRKAASSAKRSSRTSEPRRSTTPSDKILSDDSEAETIIGSSKHTTPLKARQPESDDAASQYTNGGDRTSPDVVLDDPPPSTRKRKAASASDGSGRVDGTSNKSRLVSKRVRLTQDEDAAAQDKAAVKIKSEDGEDNAGATPDKHDPAVAVANATNDVAGDLGSRAAKPESSQSPKSTSRHNSHDYSSTSNRASTHEPRTRSQSPSHPSHKRSASLQSGSAGGAPADHERRLRSRRGATETAIPVNPSRLNTAITPTNPPTPLSATMSRAKDQDRSGRTALFRACEEGDPRKVAAMLPEAKNDIERPDNAQNKPLQAAALLGKTGVVELLLKAGCEVNGFNDAGDTALIDAIDNGHIKVVQLLLEYDADPWQKNNEYEMPRDRLDMMDDGPERDAIAKLLSDATIERFRREPTEPYMEPARDRRRPGLHKDRIYSDVNIDMMRKAFLYNDNDTISDLLRHSGVVPDNSCAVAAAKGGHVRPLEKLVVLDPNPNDVDQTPMLEAIGRGNLEVVEFLLISEGFNPGRIIDGKTYYQIARDLKGPRSREEVAALKAAYRGYRDSKSASERQNLPVPSEDELEDMPSAPNATAPAVTQDTAEAAATATQPAEVEQPEATTSAEQTEPTQESHLPVTTQTAEENSNMEATTDVQQSSSKRKEATEKDSSDESVVQSPRAAGKRRRLVSGAMQNRHKTGESSTSDEKAHEEEEQKRLAEEEEEEEEAKRKAQEAEEAEKIRLAAEAKEKRKAAEEEERQRKEIEEEEERKRKAEEEEQKRRAEEEERRRLEEEEEAARRKAEEEERRRLEEEERIRRAKEEEEARLAAEAEARRLAEEEARRVEEEERARQAALQAAREAREAYLASMPRGFRHPLQEGKRLKQTRPAGAAYQHLRTLEDWKPIIIVQGHELEGCPEGMKEKMWMPNFFASLHLHHDRLDECSKRLGWQSLPMTPEQRTKLTVNVQLKRQLNLEQNWVDASPQTIIAECPDMVGVYYDGRGRLQRTISYEQFNSEALAAFYDLPEDQLYWIPLELFMQATKSCTWLEDYEMFTRTGIHVGPRGSYSEIDPLPAPMYQNDAIVKENVGFWQH